MPVELLSPPVAETLRQPQGIEVTIVMPCLNEAETLERCIVKAQRAIRRHQLRAEVVIADNG
ncbi:MAG TPA: glycosyltransferase, partial [Pirellulales bacterium]|nr:glycosyltransferase [Pirellulales bacterium]